MLASQLVACLLRNSKRMCTVKNSSPSSFYKKLSDQQQLSLSRVAVIAMNSHPSSPIMENSRPSYPTMDYQYQIDHLQFMQAQESHYQISADYLSSSSATITADDRHALCSWSYEIIESLSNINSEIACIGMSYLDRFMATSSPRAKAALTTRHVYQLATVACTVIAIKNRGGIKHLGSDFVSDIVCHGLYTIDEIDGMEMEVLQALRWRLNGPSPHEFIDAIVGLLPASSFEGGTDYALSLRLLSKHSKLHVEAAVLDYDLAIQLSSNLAYAAILTSLQKASVVEGFHLMDLISWMSTLKSVLAGSRAVEIFIKHIGDTVKTNFSDSDDKEDDDEDSDEEDESDYDSEEDEDSEGMQILREKYQH